MSEKNGSGAAALRVRYDADADAMYLRLREGTIADTIEVAEMVYVDLDADGRPLGVEFVAASDFLPFLSRQGGELVLPERMDASSGRPAHVG